MQDKHIEMT